MTSAEAQPELEPERFALEITDLSDHGLLFQAKTGFEVQGKAYIVGAVGYSIEDIERRATGELNERLRAVYIESENSASLVCKPDLTGHAQRTKGILSNAQIPSWVRGRTLLSGEEILISAEQVFLNFPCGTSSNGSSTGLAFHESLDKSCTNAFLELIERDSIFLFWKYVGYQGIKLGHPLSKVDEKLSQFMEKESLNAEVFFLPHYLSEKLGTILTFLTDRNHRCYFGSACMSNVVQAITKALIESITVRDTLVKSQIKNNSNIFRRAQKSSYRTHEFLEYLRKKTQSTTIADGLTIPLGGELSSIASHWPNAAYFEFPKLPTEEGYAIRAVIPEFGDPVLGNYTRNVETLQRYDAMWGQEQITWDFPFA